MASENLPLSYKGHPLRRKDNLIYYGTMAEKYIIMLQVLSSKNRAIWPWRTGFPSSFSSPIPT